MFYTESKSSLLDKITEFGLAVIEAEKGLTVLNIKEISESEAHLALAQGISHL